MSSESPIEVFVVNGADGTVDGYAEVGSVTKLFGSFSRSATITPGQLWNGTPSCYRIQNQGKNFVHALVIAKYLGNVPEGEFNSASYKQLRDLVRDLLSQNQKSDHADDDDHRRADDTASLLQNIDALLRVFKTELVIDIHQALAGAPLEETKISIDGDSNTSIV